MSKQNKPSVQTQIENLTKLVLAMASEKSAPVEKKSGGYPPPWVLIAERVWLQPDSPDGDPKFLSIPRRQHVVESCLKCKTAFAIVARAGFKSIEKLDDKGNRNRFWNTCGACKGKGALAPEVEAAIAKYEAR